MFGLGVQCYLRMWTSWTLSCQFNTTLLVNSQSTICQFSTHSPTLTHSYLWFVLMTHTWRIKRCLIIIIIIIIIISQPNTLILRLITCSSQSLLNHLVQLTRQGVHSCPNFVESFPLSLAMTERLAFCFSDSPFSFSISMLFYFLIVLWRRRRSKDHSSLFLYFVFA